MKKYFVNVAVIAGLLCSSVCAANNGESNDEEAKASLRQKLVLINTFEGDFTQQVIDHTEQVVQTTEGKITLQQPSQLLWQVTGMDESLILADGQTIWQEDSFSEYTIAIPQADTVNSNPLILLAQPESEHWNDFFVSSTQPGVYSIDTRSSDAMIKTLILTFNEDKLEGFIFVDNQQQRSEIAFSNVKQGHELSSDTFKYELPPGFDLDDQR